MSLLVSLTDSKVNSLQLFQKTKKIRSGWQGGVSAGHKSVGGQILLPVVAGEQVFVASLFVEAGKKPQGCCSILVCSCRKI